MKKQVILKTIVVILLVIFAFSFTGCVQEWSDDYLYSEFAVNEDGRTITIKAPDESMREFSYIGVASGALLHGEKYWYENYVTFFDGSAGMVYSPSEEDGVLYVAVGYDVYCYASEDCQSGREEVEKILNGQAERKTFAKLSRMTEGVLNEKEMQSFFLPPSSDALVTVDVTKLKNCLLFDVLSYDAYRVLAIKSGAIFKVGEEYFYVDYDKLDNSAFDADGNLSYRKGTIEAERLNQEKRQLVESIQGRQKRIEDDYIAEEGIYIGEEIEEEAVVEDVLPMVLVLVAFLGILLPLIPLAIAIFWWITAKRRNFVLQEVKKEIFSPPMVVGAVGAVLWLLAGIAVFCIFLSI